MKKNLTLVLAGVAVAVALLALYRTLGEPAGNAPLTDGDTKVVPATGPQGFPVEAFCRDPLTQVKGDVNPDGSGVTYTLLRAKDGAVEAVVWVKPKDRDNVVGTHYFYDAQNVQQAEPALVTGGAKDCVEQKAK